MQQAIAILDSGVGGLTVAKEVMRQLPQENVIYFGDTSRAPYGPRAVEEVVRFTEQIVDYLLQYQPKMLVIACNTATALALPRIRAEVSIPVVGVVHPGARAAVQATQSRRIGVIGTENTIRSEAYTKALHAIDPTIQVSSLACPQLVELVEKNQYRLEQAGDVVEAILQPFAAEEIDCLILGCTHYPFLTPAIAKAVGPRVSLISSADETAREISALLHRGDMLCKRKELPVHRFFCSGNPDLFQTIATAWLGEQIRVTPVVWQLTSL